MVEIIFINHVIPLGIREMGKEFGLVIITARNCLPQCIFNTSSEDGNSYNNRRRFMHTCPVTYRENITKQILIASCIIWITVITI
jgi:hypothetical protein